jgi:chromate transport protein ChrA
MSEHAITFIAYLIFIFVSFIAILILMFVLESRHQKKYKKN